MTEHRIAHRGTIRRQPDGTFAGQLTCLVSGWPMTITATVQEDARGKFFALETILGPTPEMLRLPGEDKWRNPT